MLNILKLLNYKIKLFILARICKLTYVVVKYSWMSSSFRLWVHKEVKIFVKQGAIFVIIFN